MNKLSITDLALTGKRVFMRVDFNVPIADGRITDDTRIVASMPSIRYVLEKGGRLILASHLGRPKGKPDPKYSLRPVAARLAELLGRPVEFADDCVGPVAQAKVAALKNGEALVLENLRFHAEEEKNDPAFARELASLCDVYVNDAFGTAHRAHASTVGVAACVRQSAAGFLMQKEIESLHHALTQAGKPYVSIVGGAKISDKIELIENFINIANAILIGGAMAYTFFKATGVPVGRSLVEDDKLDAARAILAHAPRVMTRDDTARSGPGVSTKGLNLAWVARAWRTAAGGSVHSTPEYIPSVFWRKITALTGGSSKLPPGLCRTKLSGLPANDRHGRTQMSRLKRCRMPTIGLK
jgi:phosphoglycerate kinase